MAARTIHRGHRDFKWNTLSRIDKYTAVGKMITWGTGGIGSNGVTCALVHVVRV